MDRLTPIWRASGVTAKPAAASDTNSATRSPKEKRPAPFSLRLSFDEKQKLIEAAGRQSISAYIKSRLFDPDAPVRQARGLNPVKDHKALAQLLGMLGSSRIGKSLGDIAEAARIGALPLGDETEKAINRACKDIRIMRRFLLAALGIRDSDTGNQICESCGSAFGRAVGGFGGHAPDKEPSP